MQGIPVKITAKTIQQALGIKGTWIPTISKANKDLDQKYMTLSGLSKAYHITDKTRIKGFMEE